MRWSKARLVKIQKKKKKTHTHARTRARAHLIQFLMLFVKNQRLKVRENTTVSAAILCMAVCVDAVSYTHLTLPTMAVV